VDHKCHAVTRGQQCHTAAQGGGRRGGEGARGHVGGRAGQRGNDGRVTQVGHGQTQGAHGMETENALEAVNIFVSKNETREKNTKKSWDRTLGGMAPRMSAEETGKDKNTNAVDIEPAPGASWYRDGGRAAGPRGHAGAYARRGKRQQADPSAHPKGLGRGVRHRSGQWVRGEMRRGG